MSLDAFVQRLTLERAGLAGSLERLRAFLASETFKVVTCELHRELLQIQEEVMAVYLEVLDRRLALLQAAS